MGFSRGYSEDLMGYNGDFIGFHEILLGYSGDIRGLNPPTISQTIINSWIFLELDGTFYKVRTWAVLYIYIILIWTKFANSGASSKCFVDCLYILFVHYIIIINMYPIIDYIYISNYKYYIYICISIIIIVLWYDILKSHDFPWRSPLDAAPRMELIYNFLVALWGDPVTLYGWWPDGWKWMCFILTIESYSSYRILRTGATPCK